MKTNLLKALILGIGIIFSGQGYSQINISATSQDESCYGYCNGGIDITVSGGVPPYTFDWSNDGTGDNDDTEDLSNLCPGAYTLTVTDSDFDTEAITISIYGNTLLSIVTVNTAQSHCGAADGSASVNIAGGTFPWSYEWIDNSAFVISNTLQINSVIAGTYYFTVTDGLGCQSTETIIITDIPAPTVDGITFNDVTCHDFQNGDATVYISGGIYPFDYQWDSSPIQQTNNTTDLTNTVYSLPGGTYTVVITDDAGCIVSQSVTIYEPDTLISHIGSNYGDVSSFGGNDGWAMVQQSGGTAPYTWTWDDADMQTTQTATNLESGNYAVIVEDANGCVSYESVYIDQPTFISENNTIPLYVFPNPTTGKITIKSSSVEQIEIYNLSGILIKNTNNKEIDLSQEAKGIYLVKIMTNENIEITKLIIE